MDYHKALDEAQQELEGSVEPLRTHLSNLVNTLEVLIAYENRLFRKDLRVNGAKKVKK